MHSNEWLVLVVENNVKTQELKSPIGIMQKRHLSKDSIQMSNKHMLRH